MRGGQAPPCNVQLVLLERLLEPIEVEPRENALELSALDGNLELLDGFRDGFRPSVAISCVEHLLLRTLFA